jgi:hypothetical protein
LGEHQIHCGAEAYRRIGVTQETTTQTYIKDNGSLDLEKMIANAMAANIQKEFEAFAGMVTTPDNVVEERIRNGLKRAKLIYDMMIRNRPGL